MINPNTGERIEIGDREYLKTKPGASGHAVFSPPISLAPGKYSAAFLIRTAGKTKIEAPQLVAQADIVSDAGVVLAKSLVFDSQINNSGIFTLNFEIENQAENVHTRVFVNGCVPLLIGDNPSVGEFRDAAMASQPDSLPDILKTNPDQILSLFATGGNVSIVKNEVVGTAAEVNFYVKTQDDFNFVGEIFIINTYNILPPMPTCLIDIGMNIGFTSLFLARHDDIVEVHGYEPFKSTFDRAVANISLNPKLSRKIHAHNFGLSDRNERVKTVIDTQSSGSFSVFPAGKGAEVEIEVRDAATTLAPIFAQARSQGRLIVLKVDCEGSEFPVFKSLEKRNLLQSVDGFMVEWHAFKGTAEQLTAPLLRAGFAVIDLSPPTGNGFFYAFRVTNRVKGLGSFGRLSNHFARLWRTRG